MKVATLLGLALLAMVAALPNAARADVDDATVLRSALRAIDTFPTRDELDRRFEDPAGLLLTLAENIEEALWVRERAITLLSHYPVERVYAALADRAGGDPEPGVRALALYTVARTFAARPSVVGLVERGLRDPSDHVRRYAVRGLRWVPSAAAERLLRRLAAGADRAIADEASATLARRSARPPRSVH